MYIGKRVCLDWEAAAVYEGKIYFIEYDSNELFSYDIHNGRTELISYLGKEWLFSRAFSNITIYEGKMYIVPFRANIMYEIEISTREKRVYQLRAFNNSSFLLNAFIYKSKMYLLGPTATFIEFDIDAKKISYMDRWEKEIISLVGEDNRNGAIFRKMCCVANKIYAPMRQKNRVFIFDLEKKEFVVRIVGSKENTFSSICFDGKDFWLVPYSGGNIVRWNEIDDRVVEYDTILSKQRGALCFNDCIFWNEKVWILPRGGEGMIQITPKNGQERYFPEIRGNVSGCICGDELLFLHSEGDHRMWIVRNDAGVEVYESIEIVLSQEETMKYKNKMFQEKISVTESEMGTLREWITFLKEKMSD